MPAFHPLQKAFDGSRSAMQSALLEQMKAGVRQAAIDLKNGKG
jgi:hypothetical protein